MRHGLSTIIERILEEIEKGICCKLNVTETETKQKIIGKHDT